MTGAQRRTPRLDTLGEFPYVLPRMPGRLGPFLLAFLGFATVAWAEHEPDHRYVILGYVHDGAGRPAARVEVRAIREKTGLEQRARTDPAGFYLVIVHLHSEDLGDTIRVSANGAGLRITARFDPRDVTTHRGTRVDFLGNDVREHFDLFSETLRRFLAQ